MPMITKKVKVDKIIGLKCDRCDYENNNLTQDFHVVHTFGYGSPIDGDTVSFALCDKCLEEIITKEIPNATWVKGRY